MNASQPVSARQARLMRWATYRRVFNRSVGHTADSATAGVVNDVFTTPVPEPATGLLAAFGLLAVGLRVRVRLRLRARRRLSAVAAAAAASVLPLLASAPALAEVRFTVTNLGTLGGISSEAFAINASGQVAGRAVLANGFSHATRWTGNVAQDLGTLGGNFSNAYGINDAGQVAGDSYLVGNVEYRGVLWSANGTPQSLGTFGSNTLNNSVNAVNNSATVVGQAVEQDFPFTFYYPVASINGSNQILPGAGSLGFKSANAINDSGRIAGVVDRRGAVWQLGVPGYVTLGTLGGSSNAAQAINAAGLVAGYAEAAGTSNRRVVVWQGTAIQDLGTLGGLNGTAYGLNANGDLVGSSQTANGAYRGFWRPAGLGALVDINTMLAPGSGATVTDARAINDNGQIAGSAVIGGQSRAVRLTPSGSVTWQAGGDGSFADTSRWEQNYLPNKFVNANINSAGLQTITVGAGGGAANNLNLGFVGGSAGRPTLLLQGGAILSVAGLFTVNETGTLTGDGAVVGNVLSRGTVLPTNITMVGTFNNQGLIAGSGILNTGVLNNGAAGQVRTVAGESLQISGQTVSNAGVIDISGGGQQRYSNSLTNAAGGRIQLNNGVLRLDGGLQNAGQVQVSFGGATIHGNVATSAGGKVILSGASETTFFDPVTVAAGGELRVSNNATGVFFDLVTQRTGALFTGTGTKFYEGGLAIGASPGLGTDEGSVNFGVASQYLAEIGGITACTATCAVDAILRDRSFDKLSVAGNLGFGGQLKLVSWAGFVGQIGQRIDLFDWGSTSGTFSSIDGSAFALADGAVLDASQLYTMGVVSITAVPEPGTWALLLGGLGGLAVMARRRRRSD